MTKLCERKWGYCYKIVSSVANLNNSLSVMLNSSMTMSASNGCTHTWFSCWLPIIRSSPRLFHINHLFLTPNMINLMIKYRMTSTVQILKLWTIWRIFKSRGKYRQFLKRILCATVLSLFISSLSSILVVSSICLHPKLCPLRSTSPLISYSCY